MGIELKCIYEVFKKSFNKLLRESFSEVNRGSNFLYLYILTFSLISGHPVRLTPLCFLVIEHPVIICYKIVSQLYLNPASLLLYSDSVEVVIL